MKRNRGGIAAYFLCSALLGISTLARANDTSVEGIGGSLRPLRGEHPHLQMVRETVRLDIYPEYYDVQARFWFRNLGAAATVEMGFPERAYGDVTGKVAYKNFSSRVDGRSIAVRRQQLKANSGEGSYSALWVKRVRFAARQTREISVRYRAPVGSANNMGIMRSASYDFTGGSWQGKVEKSELKVVLHLPGTLMAGAYANDKPIEMQRSGKTFTHVWRNWQAQSGFEFLWMRTLAGWRLLHADHEPLPNWYQKKIFIEESHAPNPSKVSDAKLDFRPPALLHNGVTFITLTELANVLDVQLQERGLKGVVSTKWENGGATLRVNLHTFGFRAGRRAMSYDFAPAPTASYSVSLAAAPFSVGGRLYVPVAPVLQTWGSGVTTRGRVLQIYLREVQKAMPESGSNEKQRKPGPSLDVRGFAG